MKSSKSSTSKEKETVKEQQATMSDMTNKAMKNYEQAVRTGMKFQEEAGRYWSGMFNQASYAQDWQKRMASYTSMANGLLPLAQRRMEDMMDLMEKSSRMSADLLKKATDAAQTPTVGEAQSKWLDFWTSAMVTTRANMEAASQVSTRAIDSWIDFVKKNSDLADLRTAKAA